MKGYTDRELEVLWEQFGDLPMNPETECMEAAFLDFPAGTHREEIWHWFDERYSKGVAALMYYRTYTVTEVCPYCENEIEMRWDTDRLGYKAFCPVCGNTLMLCDECLHSGPDGELVDTCDYDSITDTCRYNRKEKRDEG